jgi:hypothetical protein
MATFISAKTRGCGRCKFIVKNRELDQMCDRVASEAPDVLEQAAAALLAENNGFRFLWHWFSVMGTFLPFEIITYAI